MSSRETGMLEVLGEFVLVVHAVVVMITLVIASGIIHLNATSVLHF